MKQWKIYHPIKNISFKMTLLNRIKLALISSYHDWEGSTYLQRERSQPRSRKKRGKLSKGFLCAFKAFSIMNKIPLRTGKCFWARQDIWNACFRKSDLAAECRGSFLSPEPGGRFRSWRMSIWSIRAWSDNMDKAGGSGPDTGGTSKRDDLGEIHSLWYLLNR